MGGVRQEEWGTRRNAHEVAVAAEWPVCVQPSRQHAAPRCRLQASSGFAPRRTSGSMPLPSARCPPACLLAWPQGPARVPLG